MKKVFLFVLLISSIFCYNLSAVGVSLGFVGQFGMSGAVADSSSMLPSSFRDFDMGPIWFLIILYLAELVAYPIFYNKKSNSFWIVFVCCLVAVLWFTLKLVLPANFLSSWFLRFLNGLMWLQSPSVSASLRRQAPKAPDFRW